MKKFKNTLIIILILTVALWLLQKLHVFPAWKDVFQAKPVVIDETPILIKEIKSIGQLITYTSSDEVVADSAIVTRGSAFVNAFNQLAPVPLLPSANKQLVLIGKGKVVTGTNLTLLTDTSLIVKNDTVILFLPKPQIFDVIMNPSDFETFAENGQWTNEEVLQIKIKARKKLEARALQHDILAKADAKAKTILQDFLGNLGYKKVIIY